MESSVRFIQKGGNKLSSNSVEKMKVQIQKIDGSVMKVSDSLSYVDVVVPEGNFNLIKSEPMLSISPSTTSSRIITEKIVKGILRTLASPKVPIIGTYVNTKKTGNRCRREETICII